MPILTQSLEDNDLIVRTYAALALGAIGLEKSIDDLTINISQESEPEVREALIRGLLLVNCTREKKGVISVYIQSLMDPDTSVRKTAFYALSKQIAIDIPFDPEGEKKVWMQQMKEISQWWDQNMNKTDLRKCVFPGDEFMEVRGLKPKPK